MATPESTVVALASFVAGVDGKDVVVLEGEAHARSEAVVKKYPQLFTRSAEPVAARIEQATAAPGEKRGAK